MQGRIVLKPMADEEKKHYIAEQIKDLEFLFWDRYGVKITGITSENIILTREVPDCRKIAYHKGKKVLDMCGDPIDECDMHNFEIIDDVPENTEDHFHSKYIGKINK